jgi:glycosyltransferase involved in cell wall biosynthesis
VVHCFKPIGYSGAVLLLGKTRMRRRRTTPLLAVDCDDLEGRGGWADRAALPPVERWIRHQQERLAVRRANLVTVASAYLARVARTWTQAGGPPVYLPNAVQPLFSEAARPDPGLVTADELLLYTRFNEFGPRRGALLMTEILQRLPGARLKVVGDTASTEAAGFFAELRSQQLRERVDVVGLVSGPALLAALTTAAVALWPFDETAINRARSPVKFLELMAAGNAIVAEDVGEVRTLGGDCVRLVPPDSLPAFVNAVVALVTDCAKRTALGRAARARAVEIGDWADRAQALESSYFTAHKYRVE